MHLIQPVLVCSFNLLYLPQSLSHVLIEINICYDFNTKKNLSISLFFSSTKQDNCVEEKNRILKYIFFKMYLSKD